MAVTAEVLRELHHIHSQLALLNDRLNRGPRQIEIRKKTTLSLEQDLETARENAKQMRMASDKKQLDLATGEQRIVALKTKLNTANSNVEFHGLQEQIAAAEMANSVLQDEILESFDRSEELNAEVARSAERLQTSKKDLEETSNRINEATDGIKHDISLYQTELVTTEKNLSGPFKADYDRIIRNKGAEGLAVAENDVCTACGTTITLNMQNDLLLAKTVWCQSCGVLLYLDSK